MFAAAGGLVEVFGGLGPVVKPIDRKAAVEDSRGGGAPVVAVDFQDAFGGGDDFLAVAGAAGCVGEGGKELGQGCHVVGEAPAGGGHDVDALGFEFLNEAGVFGEFGKFAFEFLGGFGLGFGAEAFAAPAFGFPGDFEPEHPLGLPALLVVEYAHKVAVISGGSRRIERS